MYRKEIRLSSLRRVVPFVFYSYLFLLGLLSETNILGSISLDLFLFVMFLYTKHTSENQFYKILFKNYLVECYQRI